MAPLIHSGPTGATTWAPGGAAFVTTGPWAGSLVFVGLLCGEARELPNEIAPGAVAVFLYLLLVGSLTGFVAFNWLLGHVSAAKVGTYAYVNPLVAILIGWGTGEAVTGRLWAAIGVILFGVFLVRSGERSPTLALVNERPETAS